MRLLFAFFYMGIGFSVYFYLGGDRLHPFIGIAVGFGLMFSSVIVCNEGVIRRLKGQTDDEYIGELIEKKLVIIEQYKAVEALTFDDSSTSCLCHIINIDNGSSLCLYGQYLYDYIEITDDPDVNQSRKFPTSEFSLIRKIKGNEVIHMEIGGVIIDEKIFSDVDAHKLYDIGITLEDGQLIVDVPFVEIKRTLS